MISRLSTSAFKAAELRSTGLVAGHGGLGLEEARALDCSQHIPILYVLLVPGRTPFLLPVRYKIQTGKGEHIFVAIRSAHFSNKYEQVSSASEEAQTLS
jgi:hypothetical protein